MAGVSFPNGNPIDRQRKFREAITQGAIDGVTIVCIGAKAQAQQALTDLGKVDQGILKGSIDFDVKVKGGYVIGRVFAGATHGQWVEFGRRGTVSNYPGISKDSATAAWPPVAAILAWVQRHNSTFAVSGRTKSGKARAPDAKQLARVAFLVARKIYRFGIKPTPFLIPTFMIWSKRLNKIVGDAIQRRKAQIK